jgi:GTP-binding protein
VLDARKASPASDLRTLREELEAYKPGLASRARVVALNKADELLEEEIEEKMAEIKQAIAELGDGTPEILVVSAKFGTGMEQLVNILAEAVDTARPPKPQPPKKKEAAKIAAQAPPPLPPVVQEPAAKVEDLFEM